jgi:hypothetical protein
VEDRREIGTDEVDDHRWRQHILDVFGDACDEAAPRAKCCSGERVGPGYAGERGSSPRWNR